MHLFYLNETILTQTPGSSRMVEMELQNFRPYLTKISTNQLKASPLKKDHLEKKKNKSRRLLVFTISNCTVMNISLDVMFNKKKGFQSILFVNRNRSNILTAATYHFNQLEMINDVSFPSNPSQSCANFPQKGPIPQAP